MIYLTAPFLLRKKYVGMTVWPFIILKEKKQKEDLQFVNHEKIHLRQQLEMLVLPFFIWYGLEFLFRLLQFKNAHLAYGNISFEREAYSNETDLKYLKSRRFFRFLNYV